MGVRLFSLGWALCDMHQGLLNGCNKGRDFGWRCEQPLTVEVGFAACDASLVDAPQIWLLWSQCPPERKSLTPIEIRSSV